HVKGTLARRSRTPYAHECGPGCRQVPGTALTYACSSARACRDTRPCPHRARLGCPRDRGRAQFAGHGQLPRPDHRSGHHDHDRRPGGRPVVHGTEAPGEALRRQARDLIETIPAIELPTAIAFMEFLKQRSAEAMAKATRDADAHDTAVDSDKS